MEILIALGIIGFIALFPSKKRRFSSYSDNPHNHGNFNAYRMPKPQIKKLNEKQIEVENLKLSDEQQKIFDIIENQNRNVFITGKAGTGKSALLQYFKYKSKKRLVVVAPTGIAALNVGGQTIHSLFRIPPAFTDKNNLKVYPKTALLLRNIDTLVVDEISMVRADLMDAIDHILKAARRNTLPFGGVQVVMFGDLYQLPPVVNDPELHKYFAHNHGGYYFFNAHVWRDAPLDIYELSQIFRQKDEDFKNILNEIRLGSVSENSLSNLNRRVDFTVPEEGVITLATTNASVNSTNVQRLSRLSGKLFSYKAEIEGDLEKSSFPTEEELELKVGAQVMFLKNDKEKRWVNGTIGFIKSLSEDEIKVDIDGIVYPVEKETWNKIRYFYNQRERKIDEEVISSFTQYPLRLAWAVTIHKSQGQTYGSVAIDLGDGAFAHGQTYVALSRCKMLETLYLKREVLAEDIIVDSAVTNFMSLAKVIHTD